METANAEWAGSEPAIITKTKRLSSSTSRGLAVHADGKHERATLVDWLAIHYPELQGVGEEQRLSDGTIIERPGIVHRIDPRNIGRPGGGAQPSGRLII